MPPDRATAVAKSGPNAVLLVVFLLVILWAGVSVTVGDPLSAAQRSYFAACVAGLFALTTAYQAVFMIVFPTTAVEEEIGLPQGYRSQRRIDLTPQSVLGARIIGLLGIVMALLAALLTAFFALVGLGGGFQ